MDYRIPPGVEAVEKLENFIVVNRLNANTRIPSERDLCEMWGVSRSTLRQAVDSLVDMGTLYRVKNSGVYVSPPKINRNTVGVDAMLGELRQQGMVLSKKMVSQRTLEATKQISRKLNIPLGRKVYEYVRLRKMDHVPGLLETTYIDCKQYPDFEKYYTEKTLMNYVFRNVYHKHQSTGVEHISVTYASEDEASMLEIEPGTPLFFTSGVVSDEDGVPITYYKQLLRSDMFKFVTLIHETKERAMVL